VITRTQDRDFWTFSSATDQNGHYSSFFAASDETAADPVPLAVGVAYGGVSYGGTLGTNAPFDRLHSSSMNIQLGKRRQVHDQQAGLVSRRRGIRASWSGVSGPGRGDQAGVANRWPDAQGHFTIVLPRSARGKVIRFWENQRQFFTRSPAAPGGPVDLSTWPTQLGTAAPAGLASLTLSQ